MAKEIHLPEFEKQPGVYAQHLKNPTSEEMTQNHADFYRYLHNSTLQDKDIRMNLVAQYLEYTPTDIEGIINRPEPTQQTAEPCVAEPKETAFVELIPNVTAQRSSEKNNWFMPEVRDVELRPNEQAFFTGFSMGEFQRGKTHRGNQNFVWLGTNSVLRHREALKGAFESIGDEKLSKLALRMYVASPNFDFMLEPEITPDTFDEKRKFAPFLFGLMHGRMSTTQARLAHDDPNLLKAVRAKFTEHFGFNIGPFGIDKLKTKRNGVEEKVERELPVIRIKRLPAVVAALEDHYAVRSLPFIDKLPKLVPARAHE